MTDCTLGSEPFEHRYQTGNGIIETPVNVYSDDTRSYDGARVGDSTHDNTRVLVERRFLTAKNGNEAMNCRDGSRPGSAGSEIDNH